MRCRSLILACGAAVAVSMPAMAQGQDRNQDRDQDERGINSRLLSQTNSVESLLDDLEGTWKVEVEVSPRFWSMLEGKAGTGDISGFDAERPGARDGERPARDGAQPDRPTTPDRSAQDSEGTVLGGKTLTGYAQNQLILGKHVLRETFVMTGEESLIDGAGDRNQQDRNQQDRDQQDRDQNRDRGNVPDNVNQPFGPDQQNRLGASQGGQGNLQVLSFFAFDEDSDTYSMVSMNNKKGKIHYDTGRYDQSQERIVFQGGSAGMTGDSWRSSERDRLERERLERDGQERDRGNLDDDDRPERDLDERPTQPGLERDQERRDMELRRNQDAWRTGGGQGMENVQVVLEVLGPNSYRVTMYGAGAMSSPIPGYDDVTRRDPSRDTGDDRDERQGGQPDRDATDRTAMDRTASGAGQPASSGPILYRATYTRASGADIAESRRALREMDAMSSVNDDQE